MQHEPETLAAITAERIRQLLDSPHVSDWLKTALRAADGHDPVSLSNEVEILRHLLAPLATGDAALAVQPLSIARRSP